MASYFSKITNFCPVFRYILKQQQKMKQYFAKPLGQYLSKSSRNIKKKKFHANSWSRLSNPAHRKKNMIPRKMDLKVENIKNDNF